MGRLTHIEDIEKRNDSQEPLPEKPPSKANAFHGTEKAQGTAFPEGTDDAREPSSSDKDHMTEAQREEEFHGLDSSQPMGIGHKVLIVLASAVVIIAILYIVNSWIHFV